MISFLEGDLFIASAVEANREIYALVQNPSEMLYTPLQKGAGGDVTHGIDQVAEDIFVAHLKGFGKILSEESGEIGTGEKTIYLDPLDGSDNFLSRFPYFGTSVALEGADGVESAVICNLATGRIWLKNRKAFLEGDLQTMDLRPVVSNPDPKIGVFERAYRSFTYAERLKKAKIKYRVPGAMALSLALARDLSFLLMEGELRDYDVKAGLFMCEDLYQHKHKDLTIICQHENSFMQLKKIVLEDE